eukprot:3773534-Alexandrium_andersonii.AAC.1
MRSPSWPASCAAGVPATCAALAASALGGRALGPCCVGEVALPGPWLGALPVEQEVWVRACVTACPPWSPTPTGHSSTGKNPRHNGP